MRRKFCVSLPDKYDCVIRNDTVCVYDEYMGMTNARWTKLTFTNTYI